MSNTTSAPSVSPEERQRILQSKLVLATNLFPSKSEFSDWLSSTLKRTIPQSSLGNWINRGTTPPVDVIEVIAARLGISFQEMWGMQPKQTRPPINDSLLMNSIHQAGKENQNFISLSLFKKLSESSNAFSDKTFILYECEDSIFELKAGQVVILVESKRFAKDGYYLIQDNEDETPTLFHVKESPDSTGNFHLTGAHKSHSYASLPKIIARAVFTTTPL